MRWGPVLTEGHSLQAEKVALGQECRDQEEADPGQKDREQAEETAMASGSTALEDMEEAGAAALEGAGAGEDRTEGRNDFCYAYRRYHLDTYSMIYT